MKKEGKNKKIIFIAGGILLALVAVAVLLFLFVFKVTSNNDKILIYTNSDKELKYVSSKTNESKLLSKSFEEGIRAKFNKDKSKFIYVNEKGLYLVNTNKKDSNEKVGTEVVKFNFMTDDNFYYLDSYKDLYVLDKKLNKNKIDVDVDYVLYGKKDIIIYSKATDVFIYNIVSNEKSTVTNDYSPDSKDFFVNSKATKILYRTNDNKVYVLDIKTKKSDLVDDNVLKIGDYNDDFSSIIYTKFKESKTIFSQFILDDVDESKVTKKYNCKMYTDGLGRGVEYSYPDQNYYVLFYDLELNAYKYYWNQDAMGNNMTIANDELLSACNGNDEDKKFRDEIRNNQEKIDYKDVYLYEKNSKKVLAEDIYEIVSSNINTKSVVYGKYIPSDDNKKKLSTIQEGYDLKEVVKEVKWNVLYADEKTKDNTIYQGTDLETRIKVVKDMVYYTLKENEKNSLYKFNIKENTKEQLSKNAYPVDLVNSSFDVIYLDNFNEEKIKGDLYIIKNGKKELIDNDVYSNIQSNGNKLIYFKNFTVNKSSGTYVVYDLKTKKRETIDDIMVAFNAGNNSYFVLKDYSVSSKSASLYNYKNDKFTKIEYNVTDFLYSE